MKILCVDDDALALNALKILLIPNEVIAIQNPIDALSKFDTSFDIAILDIRMPEMNGIELAKHLRKINPDIKIILLSTFVEHAFIKQVIAEKINGYLLKSNPEGILESIHSVMNHQSVFDNSILPTMHFSESQQPIEDLSNIENEIVAYIAQGYNNQEIAEKMAYSLGTIRNYVSSILEKTCIKRSYTTCRVLLYKKKITEMYFTFLLFFFPTWILRIFLEVF